MALSDLIRKIEDSPRSVKVAVVASGVAVVACAVAVLAVMNRNQYGPEPAEPVAKVVSVAPTAQAAPAPTSTPALTPSPVPTSTPAPSPTPEPVAEEPTSVPTATPVLPTPTPEVNDYYVVLHQGNDPDNDRGRLRYYASFPFHKDLKGFSDGFDNEVFYLEYLKEERVITSGQKNAYFNGEPIQVPLVSIANATYKLFKTDGYNASRLSIGTLDYLLHYADKRPISLEGDGGYVTISDGKISVSAVDDDGNTTTVNVEGVGAKELLDYWLSQNRITIDQVNEYGQTRQIQLSFQDVADLFDFDYSSGDGDSSWISEEAQEIIANEILPLFKIGD